MKILVVYGGLGLVDDPTLIAIERIKNVLNELHVEIEYIELYKKNHNISDIITNVETMDGIVLATTVEWIGIGGLMQTFLDECWQNTSGTEFKDKYLLSVVFSRNSEERDALNYLIKAWDILGGLEGINICCNMNNSVSLETNDELIEAIDKKIEDYYRIIHQKRPTLPISRCKNRHSNVFKEVYDQTLQDSTNDHVTKQIIDFDDYIDVQKQDIEELANLFKQKLLDDTPSSNDERISKLERAYIGTEKELNYIYKIIVRHQHNLEEYIIIRIKEGQIECSLGDVSQVDTTLSMDEDILGNILNGKLTVGRAFMTGQITAKGNLTLIYEFDRLFKFERKYI